MTSVTLFLMMVPLICQKKVDIDGHIGFSEHDTPRNHQIDDETIGDKRNAPRHVLAFCTAMPESPLVGQYETPAACLQSLPATSSPSYRTALHQ